MKVYVMTMAKIFGQEVYIGVKGSLKDAEKYLREHYPYMRKTGNNAEYHKAACFTNSNNDMLLFIHEEDLGNMPASK